MFGPNATLSFSSTQVTGFPFDITDLVLLQVLAGCTYLHIFRHLHLSSAYAWTVDVFDIVGPLVGQTTAVVNSQIYCGDVWTMWLWCIMAYICNNMWGSLWVFVKLVPEVEADQFSGLGTGAIPRLASPKTSHVVCCGMTDVWYCGRTDFWCASCFLPCGIVSKMQSLWDACQFLVSDSLCVRDSQFMPYLVYQFCIHSFMPIF